MKFSKKTFILVAVTFLASGLAFAQVSEEIFQGFQFNFFPPGARALAMGGAFIGLADDATAAYSNPAGMIILTKPEVSAELKFAQYSTLRAAGENVFFTGTLTESGESVASPSFASFVYPMENISIGVSMNNFMNYDENIIWGSREIPGTGGGYFYGGEGELNMSGYNFSLSVAARLSDNFSVGATASYVTFDILTNTQLRNAALVPMNESRTDGSDSGIGFTAGALFTPSDMISIGAVYSYLPKLSYEQNLWLGTSSTGTLMDPIDFSINLPDRFGFGIAIRPMDQLVIVADVLFMQYSQVTESVTAKFDFTENGRNITRGDDISDLIKTDDTVEIHVGVEYAILGGTTPFFLRAGLFTNPNHRPYYTGSILWYQYYWNVTDYSDDIEETEIGFTFGVGAVLGDSVQIDGAYLISDSISQGTVSVVIHL